MDEKSFALLERIYDLLGYDKFKILDRDDFGPDLCQGLEDKINALSTEGYLVVKYAVGGEYCLGLTAAGTGIVKSVRSERARREAAREEAAKAAQLEAQARLQRELDEQSKNKNHRHPALLPEEQSSPAQRSASVVEGPRKHPNPKRHPEENLPPRHPEPVAPQGQQGEGSQGPHLAPSEALPPLPPKHPFGFWLVTYLVATLGAMTGGGILVLILWLTHVIG
ncbi:MAG: hypothetical protein J5755_01420 [Clostridia bacterium]|nr:hypothetical protein [Clostridia bacterium]